FRTAATRQEQEGGTEQEHIETVHQKSLPITSPPLRVPTARHVATLMLLLTKRTEPSPRSRFTPLVWPLLAGMVCVEFCGKAQRRSLGIEAWPYITSWFP